MYYLIVCINKNTSNNISYVMHCPVRLLKGCQVNIGLSRVRALPLVAGSNEGGNYFWYFKSCPRVLKLWIQVLSGWTVV